MLLAIILILLILGIRIRRIPRGAGLGILRRRRHQPDPHHRPDSTSAAGLLIRLTSRPNENRSAVTSVYGSPLRTGSHFQLILVRSNSSLIRLMLFPYPGKLLL
jgi:hypothetical protein